jgi:hypothetical protein
MPDALFSLTATEFIDMLNAKLLYAAVEHDRELEKVAWQTALIMSSTGNYGKKGVNPKKLYKRQYDDLGNKIEEFKSIDREEKDKKLNELIQKFNKTNETNKADGRGG